MLRTTRRASPVGRGRRQTSWCRRHRARPCGGGSDRARGHHHRGRARRNASSVREQVWVGESVHHGRAQARAHLEHLEHRVDERREEDTSKKKLVGCRRAGCGGSAHRLYKGGSRAPLQGAPVQALDAPPARVIPGPVPGREIRGGPAIHHRLLRRAARVLRTPRRRRPLCHLHVRPVAVPRRHLM